MHGISGCQSHYYEGKTLSIMEQPNSSRTHLREVSSSFNNKIELASIRYQCLSVSVANLIIYFIKYVQHLLYCLLVWGGESFKGCRNVGLGESMLRYQKRRPVPCAVWSQSVVEDSSLVLLEAEAAGKPRGHAGSTDMSPGWCG